MSKMDKKVAESSSYNLLTVYLTFLSGILNTFVLARLLIPEEWALIILSLLFINIAIFFCNLLPPHAQDTIKYYIPHIISEEKNTINLNDEKRKFIFHIYKIRLSFTMLIFIIYLLIVSIYNFEFRMYEIILIMSPMIFFNILFYLNNAILLAYKKFKLVFITSVLSQFTVTTCNIIIFLFKFKNPLYFVGWAFLLGAINSCIMALILVIPVIPKNKSDKTLSTISEKKFHMIHKQYGSYLIIANVFTLLTGLIINLMFLESGYILFITYLTICDISVTSALLFSGSNPSSYISIFSEINYEKSPEEFKTLFYRLSTFLLLFNCLITSIMLFYIEFYIVVIYSTVYFVILYPIQLFLITAFAKMILNNLLIITHSTKNTKINAELALFQMIIDISLTYIALKYYNFYILILFYVFSSFLMTFIMFFFIKLHTDLNLKILVFFKPFIFFIVSFSISYLVNYFIYIQIFEKAYINFFINGTIKFAIFIVIFYLILYLSKLITKEEFNELVKIIPILNSKNFIIQKLVKKMEIFFPP